jgi:hypothetical protein
MPEATAPTSRWRVFRAPDAAGAIYGTIAAMAVIAGAARHPSHGRVLVLTVATLVVFWLAHVYAQALAHHLRARGSWNGRPSPPRWLRSDRCWKVRLPCSCCWRWEASACWTSTSPLPWRCGPAWRSCRLGIAYARRQQWGWPTAVTAGMVNAGRSGLPSSRSRCSCTERGVAGGCPTRLAGVSSGPGALTGGPAPCCHGKFATGSGEGQSPAPVGAQGHDGPSPG